MKGLLLLCLVGGCGDSATTLFLTIDGPHDLTSLAVTVTLDDGSSVGKSLPTSGTSVNLPGTVLVVLPDRMEQVTLDVTGHDASGDLKLHQQVTAVPHQQVKVSITLGEIPDLAVALEDGAVPDLAANDLASSDLAATDLASSDLARTPFPVPRLISNNVFSDWSGTTYSIPDGGSRMHFSVDTTGVVDGDLLFLIGSVDNGNDSVYPNPLAPGFTQLAQKFFGADGETYVVAWKIAASEPSHYTVTWNPGIVSGSMVMALFAVRGASATAPINAFVSGNVGNDGDAGAQPSVATSPGVTTTVANCIIVYAAGCDWLGSPGSNSFNLPAGFTSIESSGDRGDNSWDWTSQMIGWKTMPSPGPTGSLTGTLGGTARGMPWTAVIAIAPP